MSAEKSPQTVMKTGVANSRRITRALSHRPDLVVDLHGIGESFHAKTSPGFVPELFALFLRNYREKARLFGFRSFQIHRRLIHLNCGGDTGFRWKFNGLQRATRIGIGINDCQ